MAKTNLKETSHEDLIKNLGELTEEQNNLSFSLSAAHHDVKRTREIRKEVARIKTELRTRELAK